MQTDMTMTFPDQRAGESSRDVSIPLLDRIGGIRRVESLVDRFVDKLRAEEEVAALLEGLDLAALKKAQVAFFTEAFGGYVSHARVEPRFAHVALEAEAFLSVVVLLNATLLSLGLSEELHEELVLAIASHAVA